MWGITYETTYWRKAKCVIDHHYRIWCKRKKMDISKATANSFMVCWAFGTACGIYRLWRTVQKKSYDSLPISSQNREYIVVAYKGKWFKILKKLCTMPLFRKLQTLVIRNERESWFLKTRCRAYTEKIHFYYKQKNTLCMG